MVRVLMICLEVAVDRKIGTEAEKVVNKQVARLKADLEAVGAGVAKLETPLLPGMYEAQLDKVIDEIVALEGVLNCYRKEVCTWIPHRQDPEADMKSALFSIREFSWNNDLVPTRTPQQVCAVGGIIKSKADEIIALYHDKKNNRDSLTARVAALQKNTQSVLKGDLPLMVDPAVIHNGGFLTTVLVAVPLELDSQWLSSYTTLYESDETPMAAAGTAFRVCQDQSHSLYTVLVVQSGVDGFKREAESKGFTVRQLGVPTSDHEKIFKEKSDLLKKDAEATDEMVEWCTVRAANGIENCRLHLLALRAAADSLSRFGTGSGFMSLVLATADSSVERKMRKELEARAGRKNVLSDADWKEFGFCLADGSENYAYLSVPFEI